MNLRNYAFALLLTASSCVVAEYSITITNADGTTNIASTEELIPDTTPRWGTFKTLFAGALVGGTIGALNYATDKFFPWNWLFFSILTRNCMVHDIVDNKKEQRLLSNTAWISDWAAYCATYQIMTNKLAFQK